MHGQVLSQLLSRDVVVKAQRRCLLTRVSPLSFVRFGGSPRARAAVRSAMLCSSPFRAALNMRVASAKASGGSSVTDLGTGLSVVPCAV